MDILDILLDILLKPPQPFIGLFLCHTECHHIHVDAFEVRMESNTYFRGMCLKLGFQLCQQTLSISF